MLEQKDTEIVRSLIKLQLNSILATAGKDKFHKEHIVKAFDSKSILDHMNKKVDHYKGPADIQPMFESILSSIKVLDVTDDKKANLISTINTEISNRSLMYNTKIEEMFIEDLVELKSYFKKELK